MKKASSRPARQRGAPILDGGDSQAVALFDQLTAKRAQLAELASAPSGDADWRKAMAQLDQEANAIETELVKRSRRSPR